MLSDTPIESKPTYDSTKYSKRFMQIGIIGALASLIFWLAYDFVYAADLMTYYFYLIIRPITMFIPVVIGIGVLGFFQKYESNLAFPAMLVFLLPGVIDLLYMFLDYPIRIVLYTIVASVVGMMILTLHMKVRSRMFLVIFVTVMIANYFVPYLIRLMIMPVFPGFGDPIVILVWLSPYMIINSLYYMLTALLFVLEIRNGTSYQERSW